jgi:lipid-binding SYLF domain-containing protein
MHGTRHIVVLFSGLALVLALASRASARTEEATVRAASDVLAEFLDLRIRDIPESLLHNAKGVVIIPDLIKVGFVIGGQRGRGVVMVKEPDGGWRAPMFVTLTGGSLGWQAGAQSSDIVLVFKSQKSVEGLLTGKFTLGADAAVAAGPVGRRAAAATDSELKAEIYSYSRSRGLFAGISIDGSVLEIDDRANAVYYGAAGANGAAPAIPESALSLVQAVAKLTDEPSATIDPRAAADVPRNDLPTLADPRGQPATDADALRGELARSAAALNPLLDQSWRRYLALPAEVYQTGRHASADAVAACLKRYEAVGLNREYQTLASRAEFQAAERGLAAYHAALAGSGTTSQLSLPPPPGGLRR